MCPTSSPRLNINLVSILRCSSPPRHPAYTRRVDPSGLTFSHSSYRHSYPSVLVFSLSLYRHPSICILCSSRFTTYNKQKDNKHTIYMYNIHIFPLVRKISVKLLRIGILVHTTQGRQRLHNFGKFEKN